VIDPVQVPAVAADSEVVTVREQRSGSASNLADGAAFPGVAVIGTTFAGSVTLWNLKAQSMFGWTAAQAVGRPLRELLDVALTDEDFAEFVFIGGNGAWTRDLLMTDRSGSRFPVRMTATLAVAPDGTDELIATLQPLPAGQQAVTLSERPFRLIAERGSDLVLICDLAMTVTYAGPSLHATFGFRARDVIGTAAWQYVHPLDVDQLRQEWQAAVSAPGEQREFELRMRNATGQWRWVQLRISNLIADLAVAAMVLNLRDVTETRSMMDRLESSDRLLSEILDAALEGVWVIDPSGRTVLANARMAELLAVDQVRLANGSVFDFVDPVAAEFLAHRLGHRAAGAREQYEFSFIRRDGMRRWLRVSGVPRYSRSGRYIGSIGMCYDITDRKLLEFQADRRSIEHSGSVERPSGRRRDEESGIHRFGAVGFGRVLPAERDASVPGLERLSRREYEVVKLLLHGDRVPVIARQLFVSQSTVRNHLSSVFRKLRVRSQQELIVLLRERKYTG
jgi:PAS domain S-box-containing protein